MSIYDPFKMSGKYTLEYIAHLCECLKEPRSVSENLIFSQNGTQRFELSYVAGRTRLFEIKLLKPIQINQFNSLIDSYALKGVYRTSEGGTHQTLISETGLTVAQAMLLGSNALLNSDEAFEIDSEFAKYALLESMSKSQFRHIPIFNMALLVIWKGYEFIKYSFSSEELHFDITHFDTVEGVLFIVSSIIFWRARMKKDDIPVFKEGTSIQFDLYKAATKGCFNAMLILIGVSLFTS